MSMTKMILKFAAPLPEIENCDRFLFIGPHPDDIEIGAGQTAAKLAAAGKKVCFLICLDGRFGDTYVEQGTTQEELVKIRRQEAVKSAGVLGIKDVRFLNLCDGGYYEKEELFRKIAEVVGEFSPEVIFAPDPWVRSECHIDHLNVGESARRVACLAPYAGIMERTGAKSAPVKALAYYMTAHPNYFVGTKGMLPLQLRAIFNCHLSQFPKGCQERTSIALYLKLRSAEFGLRSFHKSAEGFRVLGTTQMHCLPEA